MLCEILTYNVHGLPWSKDESKAICTWIKSLRPSIVCLQEVFTESARNYYKEQLVREGYTVRLPRDTGVSVLPSGLLTAVLDRDYYVVSDCFCPYLAYHNVECFSNKGFHVLRLYHKREKRYITIVNTHTQSDTEISWWFGKHIHNVRRKQIQQILDFLTEPVPALVVGDLNCEHSPHPHLRFLTQSLLRKRTFYATGEDLDHIGWLPLQWTNPQCAFCDIERNGPRMESCKVLQKPWSDHAPVLATIYVPEKPKPK
jgi:endonuclease/exonuclease/phosphatase family metal-dependent hydrolase